MLLKALRLVHPRLFLLGIYLGGVVENLSSFVVCQVFCTSHVFQSFHPMLDELFFVGVKEVCLSRIFRRL